jgi:hypothetical protein
MMVHLIVPMSLKLKVLFPIVRNSLLTNEERDLLESPLTAEELDSSIEKCNMRSAPGIDGFSNAFIKKYWQFFRLPLLNYALECFRKKKLTANFRSASIKLIPKKGDNSNLKNWRPISLLSNMYKIISRAINNRLNKIVNRICSRAQKGFNSHRYTQECLINVIETIAYCNAENINGRWLLLTWPKLLIRYHMASCGKSLNSSI